MRNLVVCCDGTWNTPDQTDGKESVVSPTNVVKIFNAIIDSQTKNNTTPDQKKYYHPGVGTEGEWWEKTAGGAVGAGLNKNVMSAYRWLADNYKKNDRLFFFGFSRGAFTARSLSGMITKCGLLDLANLSEEESWKRVVSCFETGYRQGNENWRKQDWAMHTDGENSEIWFIGVWDTVAPH